jgi:CxxC-x17-CxxC domain-containing protein
MERVRVPEDERKDFYLYVDEFQNFVTEAFASILSEARKYRLNLIIAHQYTGQLVTDAGTAVRDAVFGNVGTMIVFRVGAPDADFLEQEFAPEITPEDLVALPNYNIYLKLMVDGFTSRPFSASTIPPLKIPGSLVTVDQIINTSRELYCLPKKVIEDQINRWSGNMGGRDDEVGGEGKDGAGMFKAKCAICGKDIMVPFEPVPGRPVYCKEDLVKIKAGEIQPVKSIAQTTAQMNKTYDDLSALGIEFKSTTPPPRPAPVRDTTSPRPSPREEREQMQTQRTPPPRLTKPVPHKGPDTSALQGALKDALSAVIPKALVKKAEEEKKEIKKEEPKTISLNELKKPEIKPHPPRVETRKVPSAENISALQAAIAKAKGEVKEDVKKNQDDSKLKEAEQKRIEAESLKKAEEERKARLAQEEKNKKVLGRSGLDPVFLSQTVVAF